MTNIEAVLLTGGRSSRMGEDKANILIGGLPQAARIASELQKICKPVTICGPHQINGCNWLPDQQAWEGPLAALAGFAPKSPLIFVCSCDLPLFTASVVSDLSEHIGSHEAAIPVHQGRAQPLCALYRASAFEAAKTLVVSGERRVMAWIDGLDAVLFRAEKLANSKAILSANAPEQLQALLTEGASVE